MNKKEIKQMIKDLQDALFQKIVAEELIRIDISFDRNEELWIFHFPELDIFSYGETYNEAMNDFQEDFYELYEHYVHGNPQKMKRKALEIREYLIKITS